MHRIHAARWQGFGQSPCQHYLMSSAVWQTQLPHPQASDGSRGITGHSAPAHDSSHLEGWRDGGAPSDAVYGNDWPVNAAPWISNLVFVRKKFGVIRVCVDLHSVNKAFIPDQYRRMRSWPLTSMGRRSLLSYTCAKVICRCHSIHPAETSQCWYIETQACHLAWALPPAAFKRWWPPSWLVFLQLLFLLMI